MIDQFVDGGEIVLLNLGGEGVHQDDPLQGYSRRFGCLEPNFDGHGMQEQQCAFDSLELIFYARSNVRDTSTGGVDSSVSAAPNARITVRTQFRLGVRWVRSTDDRAKSV